MLSRTPVNAQDEDEEDQIVLVDGDHPKVVEDDRDLVILEDVPTTMPLVKRPPSNYPPKTPPRRKSMGKSLHRAVLIRSAQRAVMRAEEEEEEMEVLESVVVPELLEEDEEGQDDDEGAFLRGDGDVEMEDVEMEDVEPQSSNWRKSLGRIWPFTGGSDDKVSKLISCASCSKLLNCNQGC